MNWKPEEEVNEEELKAAKQLLKREEAVTIVLNLVEQGRSIEEACNQTTEVIAYLNKNTPID